jgi:hypothetical protein
MINWWWGSRGKDRTGYDGYNGGFGQTLESAQGISLGGSVSDSAVVIATTSLAVVIGLFVILVWRRSWDQSGDKEVKPVVVPKLSEWIEAQEKEEQRWRLKREERWCAERERGRTDAWDLQREREEEHIVGKRRKVFFYE